MVFFRFWTVARRVLARNGLEIGKKDHPRPRLPETSRVDGVSPPRNRRAAQEELVQSMFDTFDADLVDLKMKYRDRIADFAVHPIMEIYLGRQTMDG